MNDPDRPSSPSPASVAGPSPQEGPAGDSRTPASALARHAGLAAAATDLGTYAEAAVRLVSDATGCSHVVLRRCGADGRLPIVASIGVSPRFVAIENAVTTRDDDCLCMRVASGEPLPPCVAPGTPGGAAASFDDLDRLRADSPDANRLFRARCLDEGLRTFALFPVPMAGFEGALLLVADPRPGMLTPAGSQAVSSLAPAIGLAIRCLEAERSGAFQRLRLRRMAESIPLPVWVVGPDRRVVFQNPAHTDLFGTAAPGVPCHRFLCGRDAPCADCNLAEVQDGRPVRTEWKAPVSGRVYDVLGVPLDGRSGTLKAEFFLDASDRLKAEALLRRTQRMDSLGGLAAGIAHDFNNVLAGVSGYAQLGEQRSSDRPDLNEPFRQIRSIADRGAELTRKILAFSRDQPLRVVPLDVNDVVRALQPMLLPLAGEGVSIRLALSEGLWAALGDRGALEQAVFNLCTNAVEAMPAGGTLTIATANVPGADWDRIRPTDRPSAGILLRVADTGCGMTREVADRIFEPFFTTKGRGRGTGLGLSVTYGIVRQLGGTIVVDSVLGRGTTMTVYLPSTTVTPSRALKARAPSLAVRPRFGGRAVVVEDESSVRELVGSLLSRLGFDVQSAPSGEEALRLVLGSVDGFDLVVTDVAMPGMNGCELARRIQSLRPSTAVLLMTGCSEEHLSRYGVSDAIPVLFKPFDIEEFESRVDDLVGPATMN